MVGMTTAHHPGWDQHPGVRGGRRLGSGERACLVLLGSAVAVAALVVSVRQPGAGAMTWLAAGLSGIAVVEVTVVLVAARRAGRIARELALYQLDQSRRAAAVAQDLRAEMQRLRDDVARLAAHADISGYPARRG